MGAAADSLRSMADDVAALPTAIVTDAAADVDRLARAAAAAAGFATMSGLGAELATTPTFIEGTKEASADVEGTPAGAWAIVNSGTKPHAVAPRMKKALAGGLGHPVRGPVKTKRGMAGRHVWRNAVAPQLDDLLAGVAERHLDEVVS